MNWNWSSQLLHFYDLRRRFALFDDEHCPHRVRNLESPGDQHKNEWNESGSCSERVKCLPAPVSDTWIMRVKPLGRKPTKL